MLCVKSDGKATSQWVHGWSCWEKLSRKSKPNIPLWLRTNHGILQMGIRGGPEVADAVGRWTLSHGSSQLSFSVWEIHAVKLVHSIHHPHHHGHRKSIGVPGKAIVLASTEQEFLSNIPFDHVNSSNGVLGKHCHGLQIGFYSGTIPRGHIHFLKPPWLLDPTLFLLSPTQQPFSPCPWSNIESSSQPLSFEA